MAVSVTLRPPGLPWLTIGEVGNPRVIPSSVALQSDEFGSLSGSFVLTSRAEPIPALLPFTPVRVEIDGLRVWSGYVKVATRTGRQVGVELVGQQAHLDGDLLRIVPGDARLDSWSPALCQAGQWTYQGQQEVGSQAIVLSWPNDSGTVTSAAGEFNGCTYLSGQNLLEAILVSVSFTQAIGARFVVVCHDSLAVPSVGGLRIIDVPDSAGGVYAGDTGGARYQYISIGYTGMPTTIPNGTAARIPAIVAFDRAAYLAGLHGSDVARRVRQLVPQLSADESRIVNTPIYLPHLERTDPDTGRSILSEAGVYDDTRVLVDAFDRLVFEPRSAAAAIELGGTSLQEAPDDPSNLAGAVEVAGQTVGGQAYRRRFTILDDPAQPIRPGGSVPNPDFPVDVSGWTPSATCQMFQGTAGALSPFAGYGQIQSTTAGIPMPSGSFVDATITGPFKAGVPVRVDLWAFDLSTQPTLLFKVPTLTFRIIDLADLSGLVQRTMRLNQATATPYPWAYYSLSWVPRFDCATAILQLFNEPFVTSYPDGALASYAVFPTFTGVRVWTADTLLSQQRVSRVGQVSVPVIASDEIAQDVAVAFLRQRTRLGFTGRRVCSDGQARDARTHAPLPAAALLGMTAQLARIRDRLDPATGAVGATGYLTHTDYSHAERQATVTLGERYGDAATLIAQFGQLA